MSVMSEVAKRWTVIISVLFAAAGAARATEQTYSLFVVTCNAADGTPQLCDKTFTVHPVTDGVLMAQYTAHPGACSALRVYFRVDGVRLYASPFLNANQQTSLVSLGPVSPGTHQLDVEAEGALGGCNTGSLNSWGGTLRVVTDLRPTASAGPDQSVNEESSVTLHGSGTDPEGDPITYLWQQLPGGPTVALSDPSAQDPSFEAPLVPSGGATLTFELTVSDGSLESTPSTVNVTVKNVNHPPVAQTGPALTVAEGSAVQLDGTASYDVDGEALTYVWTQTVGSTAVLAGVSTPTPSFTAPLVGSAGETLTFQLVVNDGTDDSLPAVVNVDVTNVNQSPTAVAGGDITANENSAVSLSGSGTDSDLDPLTYRWTQTAGSPVVLSDPTAPNPTFSAPFVDPGGEALTFALIVNDGHLDSLPSTVTVRILNSDDPPSCAGAMPTLAQLWPPNHRLVPVGITGVIDPQGDPVALTITSVSSDEPTSGLGDGDSGPDAVIIGETVLLRAERWDNGDGRAYTIHFTATDPSGESCVGSVQAGTPKSMKKGSTWIDGGQAYDATTQ